MANREWVLARALQDLESDIVLCEGILAGNIKPNYDQLGTLRVNLEVVRKNIQYGTLEQLQLGRELRRRAEKILEIK